MKDFEVGRVSWIISKCAQCNHKSPYEEEAEGSELEKEMWQCLEVREEDLKMLCRWPGRWRKGPRWGSPGSLWTLERANKQILEPPEGIQPCWFYKNLDFITFDLQKCNIINLYCFKPVHLWWFVTTAIGNKFNDFFCLKYWQVALYCKSHDLKRQGHGWLRGHEKDKGSWRETSVCLASWGHS